jgi:predicted membrane channel-forming protein YqfA (hemolysin III family)
MRGRRLALGGALTVIVVLSFLTVVLMVQDGVNARTVVSLLLLALIGFGVVGALTHPPDE